MLRVTHGEGALTTKPPLRMAIAWQQSPLHTDPKQKGERQVTVLSDAPSDFPIITSLQEGKKKKETTQNQLDCTRKLYFPAKCASFHSEVLDTNDL